MEIYFLTNLNAQRFLDKILWSVFRGNFKVSKILQKLEASYFSLRYHHVMKNTVKDNKENDHQR